MEVRAVEGEQPTSRNYADPGAQRIGTDHPGAERDRVTVPPQAVPVSSCPQCPPVVLVGDPTLCAGRARHVHGQQIGGGLLGLSVEGVVSST